MRGFNIFKRLGFVSLSVYRTINSFKSLISLNYKANRGNCLTNSEIVKFNEDYNALLSLRTCYLINLDDLINLKDSNGYSNNLAPNIRFYKCEIERFEMILADCGNTSRMIRHQGLVIDPSTQSANMFKAITIEGGNLNGIVR